MLKRGDMEERTIEELNFCGLWRQGRKEKHRFLMIVDTWRISWGGRNYKLWVQGRVIHQFSNGLSYPPKILETVMPKRGFIFVPDIFHRGMGESLTAEGRVFGPPPLQSYVDNVINYPTDLCTRTRLDYMADPRT